MNSNSNENKNRTRTTTQDYGVTSTGVFFPSSSEKKEGKIKRAMRFVFVKNFELKLLAIGASVIMWVLAAGLM